MSTQTIAIGFLDSPIGALVLGAGAKGCCLIEFVDRGGLDAIRAQFRGRYGLALEERADPGLDRVRNELAGYFAGTRRTFSFPMHLEGTGFERAVWREVLSIPYGETRTYGAIAASLGRPSAPRAVGRANGRNPLAIAVPCHRVLGKGGVMCGYGGGVRRKARLLALERGGEASPAECYPRWRQSPREVRS